MDGLTLTVESSALKRQHTVFNGYLVKDEQTEIPNNVYREASLQIKGQ